MEEDRRLHWVAGSGKVIVQEKSLAGLESPWALLLSDVKSVEYCAKLQENR